MKSLNKKGFTLIELLAVIVIMGILMFVAIPAVSRTIENSRKDTFRDTAKQYANQVKTLWASDGLKCGTKMASAVDDGNYYVIIDSTHPWLLEQGGKSSWGNREVEGWVRVTVRRDTATDRVVTYFDVTMSDGVHGISLGPIDASGNPTRSSDDIVRGDVVALSSSDSLIAGSTECKEV